MNINMQLKFMLHEMRRKGSELVTEKELFQM